MRLNPGVFDVWVFRRLGSEIRYLVLQTSQVKADRHFNGGRFWQIPSGACAESEAVTAAIDRVLAGHGLTAASIWAAEHAYTIYNRRFAEMQIIGVYAAETTGESVRLNPDEHADFAWMAFDDALRAVHYRGLKDGLRSTREYVTGAASPARELQLR